MIYGEKYDQWRARMVKPSRWFAWHPVTLSDGRRAWLQYVTRRKEFDGPPVPWVRPWIYEDEARE